MDAEQQSSFSAMARLGRADAPGDRECGSVVRRASWKGESPLLKDADGDVVAEMYIDATTLRGEDDWRCGAVMSDHEACGL